MHLDTLVQIGSFVVVLLAFFGIPRWTELGSTHGRRMVRRALKWSSGSLILSVLLWLPSTHRVSVSSLIAPVFGLTCLIYALSELGWVLGTGRAVAVLWLSAAGGLLAGALAGGGRLPIAIFMCYALFGSLVNLLTERYSVARAG